MPGVVLVTLSILVLVGGRAPPGVDTREDYEAFVRHYREATTRRAA